MKLIRHKSWNFVMSITKTCCTDFSGSYPVLLVLYEGKIQRKSEFAFCCFSDFQSKVTIDNLEWGVSVIYCLKSSSYFYLVLRWYRNNVFELYYKVDLTAIFNNVCFTFGAKNAEWQHSVACGYSYISSWSQLVQILLFWLCVCVNTHTAFHYTVLNAAQLLIDCTA